MLSMENCVTGWMDYFNAKAYGFGLWKAIASEYEGFMRNVSFKMGNDNLVLFWDDVWCGSYPLKIVFLKIFSLSMLKKWDHFGAFMQILKWSLLEPPFV